LVQEYNELNDEIALESIQSLLVQIEEFVEAAVKKWLKARE